HRSRVRRRAGPCHIAPRLRVARNGDPPAAVVSPNPNMRDFIGTVLWCRSRIVPRVGAWGVWKTARSDLDRMPVVAAYPLTVGRPIKPHRESICGAAGAPGF